MARGLTSTLIAIISAAGRGERLRPLMVRDAVYPAAEVVFDAGKPDGMPRKLLDLTRLHALG